MEQEFSGGHADVLNGDSLFFKRLTSRRELCPLDVGFMTSLVEC
jgi:hypothetical protein